MSRPSAAFRKAEASYLGQTGETPRQRMSKMIRTADAVEAVSKLHTVDYFKGLINDQTEGTLWMMFITGKAPQTTEDGKIVMSPEGRPVMQEVELNPISWAAFKRAVEYKRGQPVNIKVDGEGDGKPQPIEINIIGATPEFFEKQAQARGLLKK